ncbi:MAG: hypothetical protein IJM30_02765 [Thermoguttaceae bacterium]|nr:hypothetical protein [Thermoguttaceae bacterium]
MNDLISRVGVLFANLAYDPSLPRPKKDDYDGFAIDFDWLIYSAGWLFIIVVIAILVAASFLIRHIVLSKFYGNELKSAEKKQSQLFEDKASNEVLATNQDWVDYFRSKRDSEAARIPICFFLIIALLVCLAAVRLFGANLF